MKTKKLFLSLILSVSVAAFLSSSLPNGSHSLAIGEEAPTLSLASATHSLDSLKGQYYVVNFWSASDAQSRINNRNLAMNKKVNGRDVKVVSINIDSDKELAREIVKADKIGDDVISLSGSDVSSDVLNDYQVKSGCRTFLIDPYGNLESIL
ncbi:MAG: redoxin domain-containing protein [Muribaculaceae bacterium]|nr:redoxin domain-containing protein [Muribaculaceae bacterium]MDE6794848.1 redoxin domain-containing protein [Muribaculaceae bacterium]